MSDIPDLSVEAANGVVLTTQRMVLRSLRESDVAVLHERVFGVPDVMRWVFFGKTLTEDETGRFIHDNFKVSAGVGLSVLADKATGELLGFAGLNRCAALSADDLEIGFVLAKQAWGRGLATEIGQAQLDFGFRQLRCIRLLALAASDNTGSIRTLEKLGMRHHSDASPSDRAPRRVFCIDRSQWLAGRVE